MADDGPAPALAEAAGGAAGPIACTCRHCSASALGAQAWPSAVAKASRSTARRTPLAWRSATKRPLSPASATGSRLRASRTETPRRAASSVSASGTPWSQSTQARSAASPCCRSTGRSTWRRSCDTSARGSSANSVPFQRGQSPARDSSAPRACATSVKRAPQSGGGVASSRSSWRRPRLRTSSCTSLSCSGGAARCSSTQRSVPPRIKNSCCSKNQSAATAPSTAGSVLAMSSPATNQRPCASRRTSSRAPSISNWSKRSRSASSEGTDSAADTCGSRSASRPRGSRSTTSLSTKDGTQPALSTRMWPMLTGCPSARLACASICGRHSSRRGRMSQCSVSQASRPRHHAANNNHSATRQPW